MKGGKRNFNSKEIDQKIIKEINKHTDITKSKELIEIMISGDSEKRKEAFESYSWKEVDEEDLVCLMVCATDEKIIEKSSESYPWPKTNINDLNKIMWLAKSEKVKKNSRRAP